MDDKFYTRLLHTAERALQRSKTMLEMFPEDEEWKQSCEEWENKIKDLKMKIEKLKE